MDAWIVALRGEEDALVAARATLGPPVAWVGSLEIYSFETADPATAARSIAQIAEAVPGIVGAAALDAGPGEAARERAVALALAAAPNEILFDAPTRARLDGDLLFVKAHARQGWALPLRAAALAPVAARRAVCRDAVTHVIAAPPLVARAREVAALGVALMTAGPAVLRAERGMGGGRVIAEAAQRAGKSTFRIPQAALADADGLWRALAAAGSADWLVIDPLPLAAAPLVPRLAAKLLAGKRMVLRAGAEVPLDFVPADRQIALGPLRDFDARAMVRAFLGGAADDTIVKRVARRGGGSPRALLECARAAVQLGELLREHASGRWSPREQRTLRPRGGPADPFAARVADLPPLPARVLAVIGAVGDGAREVEVLAALRGTVGHAPSEALAPLVALGLVELGRDRVALAASLRALLPAEDERVIALAASGALETGARAEAAVRAGRNREAASGFAAAAGAALARGLRAAAVRYAAAAQAQSSDAPEVVAALRDVTASLVPVVVIEALGASGDAPAARARAFDPASLEEAAAQFADRNDVEGEARMRALAEILRGNSQRALQLAGDGGAEASGRAQLVAALAQAGAGQVHRAVRTALLALASARRGNEAGGEAAALSLLSSLYRAVGREDDARGLAASAQRVRHSVVPAAG